MSQSDHLCLRCSRHMKTCCQTAEIFVTLGDVRRIEEHSGRNEFSEFRSPEHPIYRPDDSDPIWRDHAFRADGTRRVLKRQASGDCTFLGPEGCALPLEVRPLICRIYPYDYDANGMLPELARGCPVELVRPGMGLIEELGMNEADAERWRQQLYDEIQTEG
jgi:Fe-S-cluster containining protein